MVACCLAVGQREEEYLEVARTYNPDELKSFSEGMGMLVREMEKHPFQDILGSYYAEVAPRSSAISRGEFYTPREVGTLMAKMSVNIEKVIEEGEPISISDPCSGSGGLILSVAELLAPTEEREESYVDLMRVTCVDINPIAVDMCYINTTLWGIPARIYCGNTLSNEMTSCYSNLHWHRVDEDTRLRGLQMLRAFKDLTWTERCSKHRNEIEEVNFDIEFGQEGNQLTFGI